MTCALPLRSLRGGHACICRKLNESLAVWHQAGMHGCQPRWSVAMCGVLVKPSGQARCVTRTSAH